MGYKLLVVVASRRDAPQMEVAKTRVLRRKVAPSIKGFVAHPRRLGLRVAASEIIRRPKCTAKPVIMLFSCRDISDCIVHLLGANIEWN
jgi:hypothetical protein